MPQNHKPILTVEASRVILQVAQQRLVFTQGADSRFVLTTEVRAGKGWQPVFDAGRPLCEGMSLTRVAVEQDTPTQKVVVFAGVGTLRVTGRADSPLVHLALTLPAIPQPTVALWLRQEKIAFQLDQGPDSIYGSAGIPFNFGFPAAYLWDAGREAAVFFDMTVMRWMQPDGVARFYDLRVRSVSEGGLTGLGMHVAARTGRRLPTGDITIALALHQAPRAQQPTGLAALATLVQTFAPLHPTTDRPSPARWENIAQNALAALQKPPARTTLAAPWHDTPLELVPPLTELVVHPARTTDPLGWDFSTVNNHLSPSLLLTRLQGDTAGAALARQKADSLPRFYDPQTQLLRHGTRQPPHVGDKEMCWQNFFFSIETLRAAAASPADSFNPAVAGSVVRATVGLRALAKNVSSIFPQWFAADTKQPLIQNDLPVLGVVREPWQVGSYAYVLLQCHGITGDPALLADARRSMETLFGGMTFRVQNTLYDRRYTDPAEFPLTELFGNAYGILAAYRLQRLTGDAVFRRSADHFLHTLLRLTFWYEDETDPVSRALHSAGLFYPHGGAHVATPWETVEAHLVLAAVLALDPAHPLTDLLLRLTNLNRVNAFDFFPAAWPEVVRAHSGPVSDPYFPIEPFYSLEGTGGHRGQPAAYMANLALWNSWLYDALAEASDPRVLVLNLAALDGYESALAGIERRFIVYNPTATRCRVALLLKHLTAPYYQVTVEGAPPQRHAATALHAGLPLTLEPRQALRCTVRSPDYRARQARLQQRTAAQNALVKTYVQLQARAEAGEAIPRATLTAFTESLAKIRAEEYIPWGEGHG